MERDTFTKKYNFRLPDRTIEQLDKLIDQGVARNRTEALIYVIDSYEKTSSQINGLKIDIVQVKKSYDDIGRKLEGLEIRISDFEDIIKELRREGLFHQKK